MDEHCMPQPRTPGKCGEDHALPRGRIRAKRRIELAVDRESSQGEFRTTAGFDGPSDQDSAERIECKRLGPLAFGHTRVVPKGAAHPPQRAERAIDLTSICKPRDGETAPISTFRAHRDWARCDDTSVRVDGEVIESVVSWLWKAALVFAG